MRKPIAFIFIFAMIFIVSCNENANKPVAGLSDSDSLNENSVPDTTIYGKCIDAAMSSIIIENELGDTLSFMLETSDRSADVFGGILVGDKMAIIKETVDGENFAKIVINTTSLLGKWTNIAKNFDIEDGGIVHSNVQAESKPYTSWKIYNGCLLLNSDTFQIRLLGPDSLYLENKEGLYEYKRQQ